MSDPLLFFPVFYIIKESIQQQTFLAIKDAMRKYGENYWRDWRNSWIVWLPGHAITYGVMPMYLRIPWMACLSFFYMCILSVTRGGGD